MEKDFIAFKDLTLEEAGWLADLGFSVILDGDSKTVKINFREEA